MTALIEVPLNLGFSDYVQRSSYDYCSLYWHYGRSDTPPDEPWYADRLKVDYVGPVTLDFEVIFPPGRAWVDEGRNGRTPSGGTAIAYAFGHLDYKPLISAPAGSTFAAGSFNHNFYRAGSAVKVTDDGPELGDPRFPATNVEWTWIGEDGEPMGMVPGSSASPARFRLGLEHPGGPADLLHTAELYLDISFAYGAGGSAYGDWFWKDGAPTDNLRVHVYLPAELETAPPPPPPGRLVAGRALAGTVSH